MFGEHEYLIVLSDFIFAIWQDACHAMQKLLHHKIKITAKLFGLRVVEHA